VLGPLPRGTETILLTEDEPALRELTNIVLSELGYRVLSAGDGEEALRIAGQGDVKIDLLVSDVVLPNLNGKALSEKLSASYPGLKTLFVSGYTEEAISHHGVLDPGIAFLQKPFPVYALACKVRELLDRR
jgi:DNA-binding response OmpR family regulator